MKVRRFSFVIIFSSILVAGVAQAGFILGSRGSIYLSSAWSLEKGNLAFHGHSRFYFLNETFKNASDAPVSAVTYWDAQGSVGLYYGVGKNVEIGFSQIIYQDNHKGEKGYNVPDDLFLKLKVASLGKLQSPFRFGFLIQSRLPLAKYHNVVLEPYCAGSAELGITGLLSYSSNLMFPEDSFNFHVNIGYLYHNDVGKHLTSSPNDSISALSPSQQVLYGVGLNYPLLKFDFSLELYGNWYISRPPPTAYSRETYAYVTPGIHYRASPLVSFSFGFDIRISPNKDQSRYREQGTELNRISAVMPDFPAWRVNVGMKLSLTSKSKLKSGDKKPKLLKERKAEDGDVYEQIAKERKEIENAEQELEKIRDERKRMDHMLERLRRILEFNNNNEEDQKKPKTPPDKANKPKKP